MPIQSCQEGNRPGYRWGGRGKCYTYMPGDRAGRNAAKQKAIKQGIAAGETPAVRSVPAAKLNRTQALADKRIDEMEGPTAELIRPVLDRAAERAARQFSRRAIKLSETQQPTADWIAPDDILDVDALAAELRRVLDPVALALAETVQTAIFEHAQPVVAAAPVRSPKLKFDVTNPHTGLALSRSADQITYVAETTKADVRRALSGAYTDGLSIPHTADQIRDSMIEANGARATLIARTELAGIVNGASVAAVQIVSGATGDAYSKIWLTAPGAHYPRHEDYEGLDGQAVALDAMFDVGGAQLAYPGDPAGPPEEVCNCRCTVIYGDGTEVAAEDAGDESGAMSAVDEGAAADVSGEMAALDAPVATDMAASLGAGTLATEVENNLSQFIFQADKGETAITPVEAKVGIMRELGARLEQSDAFMAAVPREIPAADLKVGDKVRLGDNQLTIVDKSDTTFSAVQTGIPGDLPIELESADWDGRIFADTGDWAIPTDMRADSDTESAAAGLVNKWADSSADHDPWSLAMQRAAVDEFGLSEETFGILGGRDADALSIARDIYADKGPALRAFLRAMYENTQEQLRAQGIDEVVLYRGVKLEQVPGTMVIEDAVSLQPMSSFAAEFRTADGFGGGPGATIAVRVPIERILGSARTGYGCLNETEFIVLGGKGDRGWVSYVDSRNWTNRPRTARDFWAKAGGPISRAGLAAEDIPSAKIADQPPGTVIENLHGKTAEVVAHSPGITLIKYPNGEVDIISNGGALGEVKPLYEIGQETAIGELPIGTYFEEGGSQWRLVSINPAGGVVAELVTNPTAEVAVNGLKAFLPAHTVRTISPIG